MAKGKFNAQSEENAAAVASKKALSALSKMADTDKVTIVSEKRAGKKTMGLGKEPVAFDADGKATVTVQEARYFVAIPGFALAEKQDEQNGDDKAKTETETEEKAEGGADAEKTEEAEGAGKTPATEATTKEKTAETPADAGNAESETEQNGENAESAEEEKQDEQKSAGARRRRSAQ